MPMGSFIAMGRLCPWQILLAGQSEGIQRPLLLVIALHIQVAARAAAEIERVSGCGIGPLVVRADAGDAGRGRRIWRASMSSRMRRLWFSVHGLLDFQGFQDVLIPVLNDFGNCLRQCLGGAEIGSGRAA